MWCALAPWVHIGATWRLWLNDPCARQCGLLPNYFGHLLCPRSRGHFGIARSVRLSVPWRSCLGYRHADCLQRSHRRQPEMCGLRTRLRTDVDPPRFLPPSNCHRREGISSRRPRDDTSFEYVSLKFSKRRIDRTAVVMETAVFKHVVRYISAGRTDRLRPLHGQTVGLLVRSHPHVLRSHRP